MYVNKITDAKELWGSDSSPDISAIFRSCHSWARTPGWAFIYRAVSASFANFRGLRTIELGCGEGKISLLFSLLGAKTTLVDYSAKQLKRAKYIAEKFEVEPVIIQENILQLPKSFVGQYDVAMSFGTAEHFFGDDRQRIFDAHSSVLKKGGLVIMWVPNRYGFLFHAGFTARKLLRRSVCPVDEAPFSRKELLRHAQAASLSEVKIKGGGVLRNDFCRFILDVPRILGLLKKRKSFIDAKSARYELLRCMASNNTRLMPWNNFFSYPLVLIARHH